MKVFLAILTVALLAGGGYWWWTGAAEPAAGAIDPSSRGGRPAAVLVTAVPAKRDNIVEIIEAVGTARANESVTLTAKVTDTVRSVNFEDGQFVESGDVLVQLTNTEESALLDEARANLADARRQLERARNLGQQGLISKSSVDEAEAREEALAARLETIVARLDDRLIRAPFSGLLGFRQVSPGTLLTPTTTIATLDDISVIKLDFTIPEVSLSRIEAGDKVLARSASWPDRTFAGSVRTIGSRIDPVTRAVSVRATIPNDDGALRPGMLLSVRLQTSERMATLIPERAIDALRDKNYAYVIEDGVARQRDVTLGLRRDGWVEVIDGLVVGELVITEGLLKIRDGSSVRLPAASAEDDPLAALYRHYLDESRS